MDLLALLSVKGYSLLAMALSGGIGGLHAQFTLGVYGTEFDVQVDLALLLFLSLLLRFEFWSGTSTCNLFGKSVME